MFDKHLSALGFSEKESLLYLSLLECGRSSANDLAKQCSIQRTTAYSVLESLAQRGLISKEISRGKTIFTAENPKALGRELERERKALEEKEEVANDLIELLQPVHLSKDRGVPKLKFYDGKKNVENMLFDNLPLWENSLIQNDRILWGYQDNSFVEHYMKWLKHHWKSNQKHDIQVRLFSNESDTELDLRGKVPLRTIRSFPPDFQFSSSIWILGEFIVMLATKNKHHFAYQLHDFHFANNLRMMFALLWNMNIGR